MSTTYYLVNKNPSATIGFKTPEEIWSGRPAKYENLSIFRCSTYVHINQSKLDVRALKGVFVEYPDGVKGYMVWCRDQKKCIVSRDIVFNEAALLKGSATSDIGMHVDSEQPADTPTLKVEFFGHEVQASDNEDKTHTEAQDIDSPALQQSDLQDYQLARERVRRQTRAPDRFSYVDLITFALINANEIVIEESGSYFEAIKGEDCDKWLVAM